MLLEELANELVEVTSSLVSGRTINVMNTSGIIIASTEHRRVGSYHQGAMEAVRTGKVVGIRADQLDRYPGAKEGCNMPLRVNGTVIGAVGISGDPDKIQDVAHLLEVYATKYYQLESLLQPRLAETTLRSRLLASLLSPSATAMSAADSLVESLSIRFRFPLWTVVISARQRLSDPEHSDRLCRRLEAMSFLKKQCDVWSTVDEHLVLLASSDPERDVSCLKELAGLGYRVSLGTPCTSLWQIQRAYDQALVLNSLSGEPGFSDIADTDARCGYMLCRTAVQEAEFLEKLRERLAAAFSPEECAILLESIRTYYACGKSVSTAAARLFIHKNTLQYRVRRVLEVLQISDLPAFEQEYLVRLLTGHIHRKSRSSDLA